MVPLLQGPINRYGPYVLLTSWNCLLWSLSSLDHNRRYPILPSLETPAGKNPFSSGTMGMYQTCIILPLHNRTSSGLSPFLSLVILVIRRLIFYVYHVDLAFPPLGRSTWNVNLASSIPRLAYNDGSNRYLLRFRRRIPLFRPPSSSLRPLIQVHSQNSSQIFSSFRSRCGIRSPRWSYDSWYRYSWWPHPLLLLHVQLPHCNHVHLDYSPSFPGYRCSLRLWYVSLFIYIIRISYLTTPPPSFFQKRFPMVSPTHPSILVWCWPPRLPPHGIRQQLQHLLPLPRLPLRHRRQIQRTQSQDG